MVQPRAVNVITDTDFQRFKPVQHIQLGQRHTGNAGNGIGLTHHHRIKPATAPLAPSHRTEFASALAHAVAIIIKILGGERAAAHPRGIGFGDTQHEPDIGWPGTGTGGRLTRNGIGRRHKGIGAVVDIQHDALRALKQHAAAFCMRLFQHPPALPGKGQHRIAHRQQPCLQFGRVGLRFPGRL